jgi:hypothetical protein
MKTNERSVRFRPGLFCCGSRLGWTNVFGLGLSGLAILTELVADILAVAQRSVLNGRDVNEDVLTAVVRRDGAEALVLIEKLYSAVRLRWSGRSSVVRS